MTSRLDTQSPRQLWDFPFYLLNLPTGLQVVTSPGRRPMGHPTLWRLHAAVVFARSTGLPLYELRDLPYAQMRGRIEPRLGRRGRPVARLGEGYRMGDPIRDLLIRQFGPLIFHIDPHECRLDHDVARLAALLPER